MTEPVKISKYQRLFGAGLSGILSSLAVAGFLLFLDRIFHRVAILNHPGPLRILALALIGFWACWQIWCLATIRHWWLESRLCTTGPYRLVRHPIYAGWVLLGSPGCALLFNSWILLLLPILLFPVYSILVRKEEAAMTAVFGERYKRYAARTGRLFPKMFA